MVQVRIWSVKKTNQSWSYNSSSLKISSDLNWVRRPTKNFFFFNLWTIQINIWKGPVLVNIRRSVLPFMFLFLTIFIFLNILYCLLNHPSLSSYVFEFLEVCVLEDPGESVFEMYDVLRGSRWWRVTRISISV